MILLILLSLLATEGKVHRVPMNDTLGCQILPNVATRMPAGCLTPSHWLPFMVVEKCDCPDGFTKEYWTTRTVAGFNYETHKGYTKVDTAKFPYFRCMRWFDMLGTGEKDHGEEVDPICHPETTLVDRGVAGQGLTTGKRTPSPYESRYEIDPSYFLDSSELADIRAMLREWRDKRARDSVNTAQHAVHKVCPICGNCKPRESGWLECTAMACNGGCCNSCTHTFYCDKTEQEFDVTINECDWIVWDGGGK